MYMKYFLIIIQVLLGLLAAHGQNIVQAEYFVDTDTGYGANTQVTFTPAEDGTFILSPNVGALGLAPGIHKLFVRTKDSNGRWSHTFRTTFEINEVQPVPLASSVEFFFDEDQGFGKNLAMAIDAPAADVQQSFPIALGALSPGRHRLFMRVKDSEGNWSHTFRHTLEIAVPYNGKIAAAEYFVTTDNGFGNCSGKVFANPAEEGQFILDIPYSELAGADSFFVRVRDDVGRWSMTQVKDTVSALPLTMLSFAAQKQLATVHLNWRTTNEVNTSHFYIQRSTNGSQFSTIGRVEARNKSGTNNYAYADDIAGIPAKTIYYRLQQIDKDGSAAYSKTASINNDGVQAGFAISPNPANGFIMVTTAGSDAKNRSIAIINATGQTVLKQQLNNGASQRINISTLAKGMYTVMLYTEASMQNQKLLIQ